MLVTTVTANLKSNDTGTRSLRVSPGVGTATSPVNKVGTIAPETEFVGVEKVTAERDGEFGTGSLMGDIWWKVDSVKVKEYPNALKSGHVAERHAGKNLLIVEIVGDTPPPPPPPPSDEDVWKDVTAVTVIPQNADGTAGEPIRFVRE